MLNCSTQHWTKSLSCCLLARNLGYSSMHRKKQQQRVVRKKDVLSFYIQFWRHQIISKVGSWKYTEQNKWWNARGCWRKRLYLLCHRQNLLGWALGRFGCFFERGRRSIDSSVDLRRNGMNGGWWPSSSTSSIKLLKFVSWCCKSGSNVVDLSGTCTCRSAPCILSRVSFKILSRRFTWSSVFKVVSNSHHNSSSILRSSRCDAVHVAFGAKIFHPLYPCSIEPGCWSTMITVPSSRVDVLRVRTVRRVDLQSRCAESSYQNDESKDRDDESKYRSMP